MAGVPNPFYTDSGIGQGVAAVVKAFAPDPTSTLRTVQAQKYALDARETADRIRGRQDLDKTLAGYDVADPNVRSTLGDVIVRAYAAGLKPQETAQFLRSWVALRGGDAALTTSALVGAGNPPNVNEGVTYQDLQGRRSQIENEAARRAGIHAGATIRAAEIARTRPFQVEGGVYNNGQFVANPFSRMNLAPGHSVMDREGAVKGTAPDRVGANLKTVAPGGTVVRINPDTGRPEVVFTAPDRTRSESFTLSPGQQRFGPDGKPIASLPDRTRQEGFTLSPGQRRYGPDGKEIVAAPPSDKSNVRNVPPGGTVIEIGPDGKPRVVFTAPDRTRAGSQPTINFGADRQILAAIDNAFGVVRDKTGQAADQRNYKTLPLQPKLEQDIKTRATQLFMDPTSPHYRNAPAAVDAAIKEITGGPDNLEPADRVPGTYIFSDPKYQYRGLKKPAAPQAGAPPGTPPKTAADAVRRAAPQAAQPPVGRPPARPGADPLPYSPDGKIDRGRLQVGRVYDTPKGALRWNGRTMEEVR